MFHNTYFNPSTLPDVRAKQQQQEEEEQIRELFRQELSPIFERLGALQQEANLRPVLERIASELREKNRYDALKAKLQRDDLHPRRLWPEACGKLRCLRVAQGHRLIKKQNLDSLSSVSWRLVHHFTFVEDITEEKLLRLPGCGPKRTREILDWISDLGEGSDGH